MVRLACPVLIALLVGCRPTAPATPARTAPPRFTELSAKLRAMSPEERAEYVHNHPAEIRASISEIGMGAQPTPHPTQKP